MYITQAPKKILSLKKINPPLSPGMRKYVESVLRRKKSIPYEPYVCKKHVESILGTSKNMTKKVFILNNTIPHSVRLVNPLSKGDNLSTTFWECQGSTSTNSPPAYLFHLFGIHQRFHWFVPTFDYISGPSNPVADSLSHNFHLIWFDQFANIMLFLPQHNRLQVWTPSLPVVSAVTLVLLRKQSKRKCLQVMPPVPLPLGTSGMSSQVNWASTPFPKPSQKNITPTNLCSPSS